jgi:hypothetical protein
MSLYLIKKNIIKKNQCLKENVQLIVLLAVNIVMIHAGFAAKKKVVVVQCPAHIVLYVVGDAIGRPILINILDLSKEQGKLKMKKKN